MGFGARGAAFPSGCEAKSQLRIAACFLFHPVTKAIDLLTVRTLLRDAVPRSERTADFEL